MWLLMLVVWVVVGVVVRLVVNTAYFSLFWFTWPCGWWWWRWW